MEGVELFKGAMYEVEQEINAWIKRVNPTFIQDIKLSVTENEVYALVHYINKPQS